LLYSEEFIRLLEALLQLLILMFELLDLFIFESPLFFEQILLYLDGGGCFFADIGFENLKFKPDIFLFILTFDQFFPHVLDLLLEQVDFILIIMILLPNLSPMPHLDGLSLDSPSSRLSLCPGRHLPSFLLDGLLLEG
jgi:hypothetical protein